MQPQAMYNPGLFCPWQELKMPAKKALSKKRNKVSTSRKKVTSKKPTIKKKIVKKKVGKKKVAAKKVSKKKAPVKKVAPKKAIKKAAGKELAQKKKAPIKKAAAKRAIVAKKVVTNKAPARKKTPVRIAKRKGGQLSGPIHGIAPYKPARGEEYMSDEQLNHFRDILNAWKSELIVEVDRTVHHMQDEAANFPDPNDRATQESEFGLELRTRDRERKLLRKIESALRRIDDNSYGFCDKTGEEIGLKRLEARPVATLSLEAQERREQAGRQFRDHDDRYR
jgi:DnaK suppressor protein